MQLDDLTAGSEVLPMRARCGEIGGVGRFRRREHADMDALFVDSDPRLIAASRQSAHPFDAKLIVSPHSDVHVVLGFCRWTQILPRVVQRITISVINLMWLASGHQLKNYACSSIVTPVETYRAVPISADLPGFMPWIFSVPHQADPLPFSKVFLWDSGFRVVIEAFAKVFLRRQRGGKSHLLRIA